MPQLFHSPPQPYFEPKITERSKAFYIGINWERINAAKGRHHDLLLRLDEEGLLNIYGPNKFLGHRPWEGFKSYRGELPFDGRAVVRAQNESGICLCLSSEPHNAAGLMSNRLFEGLAAGAAIIATPHSFIDRHFADLVYRVEELGSEEELFHSIRTLIHEIRANPDAAMERAREGQRILAERFSLEGCLKNIIAGHSARQEAYRLNTLSAASVTVLIAYLDDSFGELSELLEIALAQSEVAIDISIVCDESFACAHRGKLEEQVVSRVGNISFYTGAFSRRAKSNGGFVRPSPAGPMIAAALSKVKTEYFCFLQVGEDWFRDHLASVIGAIKRTRAACFGVSGGLIENDVNVKPSRRRVSSVCFTFDENELLSGCFSAEPGRFVYSRELIGNLPFNCFSVLDGEEANLVRLAASLNGAPAQSGLATYVQRESAASQRPEAVIPQHEQRQYIRDAFSLDDRWRARLAAQSVTQRHLETLVRGAPPARWDNIVPPRAVAMRLSLDTLVDTLQHGSGLKYLGEGFSQPEAKFVWIDGPAGTLDFYVMKDVLDRATDCDLTLTLAGRRSAAGRMQHCTFVLNGIAVAYAQVPEEPTTISIRVPPDIKQSGGRMRLQIVSDHAELVYDAKGDVMDNRRLGVALSRFGLMTVGGRKAQVLKPGQVYPTKLEGEGVACFVDGFSYPEAGGTWMTGKRAQMLFRIKDFVPHMAAKLWLNGRNSRDGAVQRVSATINGTEACTFDVPQGMREFLVPLCADAVPADGECYLALNFSHAEPVADEHGAIVDNRLLAVFVGAIEIVLTREASSTLAPLPKARSVLSLHKRLLAKLSSSRQARG